jgi:hypothetical protein
MLFHASAVEVPGAGGAVVFPAASGSGKTTIAASLVVRGWGYLTDEVAGIDPATSACRAYPKPLSLGVGSQGVVPTLRPDVPESLERYVSAEWLVPVTGVPGGRVVPDAAVAAVVTPRYVGSEPSKVVTFRRSEGVRLLVENSFNFVHHSEEWFRSVAAVARRSVVARLEIGDDGQAPDLIEELMR